MKILFVRHAEPDYQDVVSKMSLRDMNFAHLTERGFKQAEQTASKLNYDGYELILASPYTRTMQTAMHISRTSGLDVFVETDLREWMFDFPQGNDQAHYEHYLATLEEMKACKGEHSTECAFVWESLPALWQRASAVLNKYKKHDKIIVVAHQILIRQFCPKKLDFAEPIEVEYTENSKWIGYQED